MTAIYHSGTPKNDGWQWLENRSCDCRLFSLHYRTEVMQWLRDLRAIEDARPIIGEHGDFAFYAQRYPALRQKLARRDRERRNRQVEAGDEGDFDTPAFFDEVELPIPRYPRRIMLDSGAYTAWNAGKEVRLENFIGAVREFDAVAGDLFDEVWLINLDVIPGQRGLDAAKAEVVEACRKSDAHFAILQAEFGERVLPVFHQGDELAGAGRLDAVIAQGRGFICLSPDNSKPEKQRIAWARENAAHVRRVSPDTALHGLATTGVDMIYQADFDTVDSASWTEHARMGTLDLLDLRKDGLDCYHGYHVSLELDEYDEIAGEHVAARSASIHFRPPEVHSFLRERNEIYRFPWKMLQWESRPRALINMSQLSIFADMWGGAFTSSEEMPDTV